ncbi:MAG TPA: hypothetical protein VMU47_06775 [Caldimonas sp.]|nr:hypothetical protein [Caldimonas sp.]
MKADARYAVLAWAAEDTFERDPTDLSPGADPRLGALGYTLLAHITAVDQLASFGRQRVFYGFLAANDAECALVFRGTERAIEWAKDAEAALVAHPITGHVHAGFWNIYDSARLLTAAGTEEPLAAGVLEVAAGRHITVAGHSLGAPLATYAAYDLASMHPEQVAARLLASPRPGDTAFSGAASAAIRDLAGYAYEKDLVPKVPFGGGYAPLSNLVEIPANPAIPDNPGSWHHAQNYAWLLDPDSVPDPV